MSTNKKERDLFVRRPWWWFVLTVFMKEVMDHTRDKRSILLSMIFPLMAPALIGVLLFTIAGANVEGTGQRQITASVIGAEYSPEMIEFLGRHDVEVIVESRSREEMSQRVKTGELSFVVVIPEEASSEAFYTIDVITDRNSPRSLADTAEIMRNLTLYSRFLGQQIVTGAGLEIRVLAPVIVEQVNVGRAPNQAYLFYNMIPSLVTFMVFMGAVYLAIDTSVGERERGSLEPLLSAPVARWELLLGKSLAALVFTALVVTVNLTAFNYAIGMALAGSSGMAPPPGPVIYLTMFALAIPMMAFAVSVQMTVASLTRSAKEAQIYLGLLPTVPLIPGLILVFDPSPPGFLGSAIPIFGQLRLFIELTSGRDLSPALAATASLSTLICAGLLFLLAARLFQREKMMFAA